MENDTFGSGEVIPEALCPGTRRGLSDQTIYECRKRLEVALANLKHAQEEVCFWKNLLGDEDSKQIFDVPVLPLEIEGGTEDGSMEVLASSTVNVSGVTAKRYGVLECVEDSSGVLVPWDEFRYARQLDEDPMLVRFSSELLRIVIAEIAHYDSRPWTSLQIRSALASLGFGPVGKNRKRRLETVMNALVEPPGDGWFAETELPYVRDKRYRYTMPVSQHVRLDHWVTDMTHPSFQRLRSWRIGPKSWCSLPVLDDTIPVHEFRTQREVAAVLACLLLAGQCPLWVWDAIDTMEALGFRFPSGQRVTWVRTVTKEWRNLFAVVERNYFAIPPSPKLSRSEKTSIGNSLEDILETIPVKERLTKYVNEFRRNCEDYRWEHFRRYWKPPGIECAESLGISLDFQCPSEGSASYNAQDTGHYQDTTGLEVPEENFLSNSLEGMAFKNIPCSVVDEVDGFSQVYGGGEQYQHTLTSREIEALLVVLLYRDGAATCPQLTQRILDLRFLVPTDNDDPPQTTVWDVLNHHGRSEFSCFGGRYKVIQSESLYRENLTVVQSMADQPGGDRLRGFLLGSSLTGENL